MEIDAIEKEYDVEELEVLWEVSPIVVVVSLMVVPLPLPEVEMPEVLSPEDEVAKNVALWVGL